MEALRISCVLADRAYRPRLFASAPVACAASPATRRWSDLFPARWSGRLLPPHPSRIPREATKEETMTTTDIALLINAVAQFIAAIAQVAMAIRARAR